MTPLASTDAYQVVLFIHILAAVASFGYLFVLPVQLAGVAKTSGEQRSLLLAPIQLALRLSVGIGLLVLISAIYLVQEGPGFKAHWVSGAFVLYFVLYGTLGAGLSLQMKRLAADPDGPKAKKRVRALFCWNIAAICWVFALLTMMIAQPGA